MSFKVSNKKQDESGRILILEVKVSDNDFLLINLYNANKKFEQLNTLSTLCNLLGDITDLHCKNIILGEEFNIFFNLTCEARGGNPKMKNKSVPKFIHNKERQQHTTVFIQRRLDYFLVSNNLQESINKTDILTTLSADHSPIFFSLPKNIDVSRGKGLWKFNNSLCHKLDFITELKNHLKDTCNRMSAEQITDEELCWEYIKYEIRKFSICFSKENAKKTRTETVTLGNKLKELEQNPDCIFDRNYVDYKNKLEQIYEEKK